jgi:hypothetical protein
VTLGARWVTLRARWVTLTSRQEPRRIVLLCAVLSLSVLMMGELNAVAPFITMWFLTCYSIINGELAS